MGLSNIEHGSTLSLGHSEHLTNIGGADQSLEVAGLIHIVSG